MTLLALLLLSTIPAPDGVVRDRVETIENNVVFSWCEDREEWRPFLNQMIFQDWSFTKSREDVRDWRMTREGMEVQRDFATGDYVLRWLDNGKLREVRAYEYRVCPSTYDRELEARKITPDDQRRKLSK